MCMFPWRVPVPLRHRFGCISLAADNLIRLINMPEETKKANNIIQSNKKKLKYFDQFYSAARY